MTYRFATLPAVCLAAALTTLPSFAASPVIRFETNAVVVTGVDPRARVLLFEVASVPQGHYRRLVQTQHVVVDDDADGIVRLDLGEQQLRRKSVWVAADLTTGDHVIGSLPGYAVTPFNADSVKKDNQGRSRKIDVQTRQLFLLCVRPGEGAWSGSVHEGGRGDDDGKRDDTLSAVLDELKPVQGTAAAPKHFQKRDLIVGIDPSNLEAFWLRMDKE